MVEKCNDLKIIDFRQQINQLVNSSNLDAGIIYYIMKDVFYEVEKQYQRITQDEYKQWVEYNQKLQEEQEEVLKQE